MAVVGIDATTLDEGPLEANGSSSVVVVAGDATAAVTFFIYFPITHLFAPMRYHPLFCPSTETLEPTDNFETILYPVPAPLLTFRAAAA
jgi:hypothetical protein